MSDIVEVLTPPNSFSDTATVIVSAGEMRDAAAEITALRAEVERLRQAEEKCLIAVDHVGRMNSGERIQEAKLMVRCAFSGKSGPKELEA